MKELFLMFVNDKLFVIIYTLKLYPTKYSIIYFEKTGEITLKLKLQIN